MTGLSATIASCNQGDFTKQSRITRCIQHLTRNKFHNQGDFQIYSSKHGKIGLCIKGTFGRIRETWQLCKGARLGHRLIFCWWIKQGPHLIHKVQCQLLFFLNVIYKKILCKLVLWLWFTSKYQTVSYMTYEVKAQAFCNGQVLYQCNSMEEIFESYSLLLNSLWGLHSLICCYIFY